MIGSAERVALFQELGTTKGEGQHIPLRPFLALSMSEVPEDITAECEALVLRILVPA